MKRLTVLLLLGCSIVTKAQINDRIIINFNPPDSCHKLWQNAERQRVSWQMSRAAVILANNIIVRANEIDQQSVDSFIFVRCPQSFEKLGNLGANGIFYFYTKQNFKASTLEKLSRVKRRHRKNVIYALNGYLFAAPTLMMSKKAVKRIEVIKNFKTDSTGTQTGMTCINIWTVTEEEALIRRYDVQYNQ